VVTRDALVGFLVATKRRTYAAQGDETTVGGFETITLDGRRVYSLSYAGGLVR
jgi:hypothetical protein